MSGLENLGKRLKYAGGNAEGRLQQDKLRGLRRALFNSYQGATAVLQDGREFKCLINPNKNSASYDNKILSIPYDDVPLNDSTWYHPLEKEGRQDIGIKCGDVFTWKETDTHWLVFLEYLEEDSYFRAQIRRCDQQLEVNGERYWVYIRGPVETSVNWNQKGGVEWNDINYSLVMYITKDENTNNFFHRFQKIKIIEPDTDFANTWQVVGRDPYYGDGMVQVFLDEYFENTIQDKVDEENLLKIGNVEGIDATKPYVEGPRDVTKYETVTYEAKKFTEEGKWYVKVDGEEKDMEETSPKLILDVTTKAGAFEVIYRTENEESSLSVNIEAI